MSVVQRMYVLRKQLTQQLRLTGVTQEDSWEAQLPLNMLGHRAWKCRLGQGFIDVLVA